MSNISEILEKNIYVHEKNDYGHLVIILKDLIGIKTNNENVKLFIDKIIKDDEIKHETKELINGINEDFKNKIDSNFKYLSDAFNNKNLIEE